MALFWVKIRKCCNPGVTVNRADAAARETRGSEIAAIGCW